MYKLRKCTLTINKYKRLAATCEGVGMFVVYRSGANQKRIALKRSADGTRYYSRRNFNTLASGSCTILTS